MEQQRFLPNTRLDLSGWFMTKPEVVYALLDFTLAQCEAQLLLPA